MRLLQLNKRSPKDVITAAADRTSQQPTLPDLNSLRKTYLERQPAKQHSLRATGIAPVLFDPPEEPLINGKEKAAEEEYAPSCAPNSCLTWRVLLAVSLCHRFWRI